LLIRVIPWRLGFVKTNNYCNQQRTQGFFLLGQCSVVLCLFVFGVASSAQVNVTTANYTNSRINANVVETTLTRSAVSGGRFGKLGTFQVDGQVYAQPLYVSGLLIPGQGTKNVVVVATMNDSVYAMDADSPGVSKPLWHANLGSPVPSAFIPDVNDVNPQIGVLSTPVIDPDAQVVYVVAETDYRS
jgi:hypothetical protein